jgi:hypothetical protein
VQIGYSNIHTIYKRIMQFLYICEKIHVGHVEKHCKNFNLAPTVKNASNSDAHTVGESEKSRYIQNVAYRVMLLLTRFSLS